MWKRAGRSSLQASLRSFGRSKERKRSIAVRLHHGKNFQKLPIIREMGKFDVRWFPAHAQTQTQTQTHSKCGFISVICGQVFHPAPPGKWSCVFTLQSITQYTHTHTQTSAPTHAHTYSCTCPCGCFKADL